jgi:hypothetical protein
VIAIGGGYADPVEDTVAANVQTFRLAAGIYCPELATREPFHPMPEPVP